MEKKKFNQGDKVSFLSYGVVETGKIAFASDAPGQYVVTYDTGGSTVVRESALTLLVDVGFAKRATDITKSLEKISQLRDSISMEFSKIHDLMIEDRQPSYELKKFEEIRTLVLKSGQKDLVAEWMAWSGYATERKKG